MRRATIAATAVALAGLALLPLGCQRETVSRHYVKVTETTAVPANSGPGSRASAQAPAMGTSLPADLPAYANVYPGATVASSVSGTSGGAKGGMIVYQTKAGADAVLAFHRQQAGKGGLQTTTDSVTARGGHTLVASGANGDKVNVTVLPTSNGTFVQMTYD